MTKRSNRYEEFEKRALAHPKVRESFEEGLEQLRLAVAAAELREKMGLSQKKLAEKIRTTQAVISRFENGGNIKLTTLYKVARALNAKVKFEFVPLKKRPKQASAKSA